MGTLHGSQEFDIKKNEKENVVVLLGSVFRKDKGMYSEKSGIEG
jgi:hypothetical protein